MNGFAKLLWATDNIEIGNIGARHYLKFSIHTPKNAASSVYFYQESYKSIDWLVEQGNIFVTTNAKPSCIPK